MRPGYCQDDSNNTSKKASHPNGCRVRLENNKLRIVRSDPIVITLFSIKKYQVKADSGDVYMTRIRNTQRSVSFRPCSLIHMINHVRAYSIVHPANLDARLYRLSRFTSPLDPTSRFDNGGLCRFPPVCCCTRPIPCPGRLGGLRPNQSNMPEYTY